MVAACLLLHSIESFYSHLGVALLKLLTRALCPTGCLFHGVTNMVRPMHGFIPSTVSYMASPTWWVLHGVSYLVCPIYKGLARSVFVQLYVLYGTVYTPYFPASPRRIRIPYFRIYVFIRRIYANIRHNSVYTPYFRIKIGCKTVSQIVHPRLKFESQQEQSFLLFGVNFFPFATPLIKHSLYFPLCFDARFCINHNVLLVVRVLGL